ncbi:MAG: hypothetical protein NVSMB52_02430 [Chloroflexota bacterium]
MAALDMGAQENHRRLERSGRTLQSPLRMDKSKLYSILEIPLLLIATTTTVPAKALIVVYQLFRLAPVSPHVWSVPDGAVDALPEEVGMPVVACVFFDHMNEDPA